MSDDEMCPNCVTPWRCNGPHDPGKPRRGVPAWVWQTTGAMLAVSLIVYYFTGDADWAAISQIPVCLIVGHLSVNRYTRRMGWGD